MAEKAAGLASWLTAEPHSSAPQAAEMAAEKAAAPASRLTAEPRLWARQDAS